MTGEETIVIKYENRHIQTATDIKTVVHCIQFKIGLTAIEEIDRLALMAPRVFVGFRRSAIWNNDMAGKIRSPQVAGSITVAIDTIVNEGAGKIDSIGSCRSNLHHSEHTQGYEDLIELHVSPSSFCTMVCLCLVHLRPTSAEVNSQVLAGITTVAYTGGILINDLEGRKAVS